jgi:hypothetical protein
VAEQQDKEEGQEKLTDAVWRKGAKKAPALAEPWGGPRMECNACRDARVLCAWPSGITKWIRSCDQCQGWKASCKIDGAPDPQSRVLKPKPVQQGEGACYIPVTLHRTPDLRSSGYMPFSFLSPYRLHQPIILRIRISSCIPFLLLLSYPLQHSTPDSCYATHSSYCSLHLWTAFIPKLLI